MAEAQKKGLEDVIAGESAICFIDGREGRLIYRGYDIHDLVQGSFEEAAYLLLNGDLPTKSQLDEFTAQLRAEAHLPREIVGQMMSLPADSTGMEALRGIVSSLSFFDSDRNDNSREANYRKAIRLLAKTPIIVALIERIRTGGDIHMPRPDLSIAGNFLWMLLGKEASAEHVRMFDTALILHADHEFNASTFTARVIAATLSDMYSAVVGAIGALKGPLHGGANEQVMRMLLQIHDPEKAQSWIAEALASKKKIMGFGHRVYRTEDPRATHLRKMSETLGKETGQTQWYEMSRTIEQYVLAEKGLYPNVDFYSASAYYMMGIPIDLFTPIFAMSRMAGWTAHIIEQQADNRLIRPAADYTGKIDLTYTPVDAR
ncbi:MAG: citrate synthase [Bacteroidetes bacterium]|nr:citrate synthase [Bacteroidota bacterium]